MDNNNNNNNDNEQRSFIDIGEQMRQMHQHMQQHRQHIQQQLHRARRLNNADAAEVPVAVAIEEDDGLPALFPRGNLRGRNAEMISSLLFDLIREECTCTSVLSGWREASAGCQKTVDQCGDTPDQAFFVQAYTGRTPLHEACLRSACAHIVKALLHANPIGAMERDHAGNYPIHLIFVGHRYERVDEMEVIVEALLAVNPAHLATAVNAEGSTPLHLACQVSMISSSILAKLVQANVTSAALLDNRNRTALHLYVQRGEIQSLEGAQILLDANLDGLCQGESAQGYTPMHLAAQFRNGEMLSFLLDRQPDVAHVRSLDGKTVLHLVCQMIPREAHLPAIRALIEAAPEALTQVESRFERTPLHILCASQRPMLEAIQLLTTPEAAAKTDAEHYTPLHHACETGASAEIIQFLLSAHNMAAWVVTRKQDTPLHIACGLNLSNETVRFLIEANREALTMTNDYGFTPLHCVCRAYQPRMGIVQALLEACPSSVGQRTNGGETAIHLACSSGAFVGVLQLLTLAQKNTSGKSSSSSASLAASITEGTTNKVGNSPLHEACFRGASFEHIETLAKATPEWIVVRNNAGYTPLQVMCKSGRLDERVVTAFSRIRGPEVFSVMDSTGHTPLHSACREGTSVAAIRSLIRAFSDALHLKTTYGDTPLHLSVLRGANADVVREIAISSGDGRTPTLLETNTAGQTPIGIAMEEFQSVCVRADNGFCSVTSNYRSSQLRAFDVLATLVKLLYYGTSSHDGSATTATQSLVKACVCLHRQDVRLDPAFIRRAIYLYPEEVCLMDVDGSYPLHIEASIPVEKMSLLDGPERRCCGGKCHSRFGILGNLLAVYPAATQFRNDADEFPLGLMIQNGRCWDQTFAMTLRHFPPALHWYKHMDDKFAAHILSKVSKECGLDTLYHLVQTKPEMMRK